MPNNETDTSNLGENATFDEANFYGSLNGPSEEEKDWISDERTPEELQNSYFQDMYVNSWEEAFSSPEEKAQFDAWLGGLEPLEREQLEATRTEIAQLREGLEAEAAPVEERLRESAPELFTGRLPDELASRLDSPYALGVNQSGDTSTSQEAAEYLRQSGGLDLRGSSPNQRFLFIDERIAAEDPAATEHALIEGYYSSPEWGRFVFVFPTGSEGADPAESARLGDEDVLPADFFVQADTPDLHGDPDTAISSKYCAGFIDGKGHFNPNANFLVGTEVDFQSS